MILIPSKYLVKVPLKNKSYVALYHSLFGGAVRVQQGVWNLIQKFKGGVDFPQSFNKEEISYYRDTIRKLKKWNFLVEKGIDERSALKIDYKKLAKELAKGVHIVNLRLEVAGYCNFRCLHCSCHKLNVLKKGSKMSVPTAKRAVDGFVALLRKPGDKFGVITYWGGECLLNWDLIKQTVEYCDTLTKKYSVRLQHAIVTNASLLNDEMLKFMKRHKFAVRISLDGLEKENDQFRKFINGKGTFQSIKKGMEGLTKYGIDFSIETCLNDYNFYSIEKMMDFVNDRYRCRDFLVGAIDLHKSLPHYDRHSNREKAKRIVEIYRYVRKKGRYRMGPSNGYLLLMIAMKQSVPDVACHGLYNSLYVSPSGLVYTCARLVKRPIGTVEKITNVPQGRAYKHAAMRRLEKIKGCRGCEIEGICRGGCAGIAEFYSGDMYNTSHPLFRSFNCNFRRHLFREVLKFHMEESRFRK